MFLDYTTAQKALRAELRTYFAVLLTDEVRGQLGHAGEGSPVFRSVVRTMGAGASWHWPAGSIA